MWWFLVAFSAALLAYPDAASAEDNQSDSRWELDSVWPGTPPDDPWQPTAILTLARGEVVVAERSQGRLFLMSSPEAVIKRLPAPARWVVEWTALAQAPGLSFFALDGPGRVIYQYDNQGNYLGIAVDLERVAETMELGPLEPAGLAVGRAGQAVVTDRLNDRILVFNASWDLISVWGETGSEPGQWRRPGAVAAAGESFLVSDTGNRRLVEINGLGNVLGKAELDQPVLNVSRAGNQWVALHGRSFVFLDKDLLPGDTVTLPSGCGKDGLAAEALFGREGLVLVGEGCTGRVMAFILEAE